MKLVWFPADGGPSIDLNDGPYLLGRIAGLSYLPASPVSERGPSQLGATLLDSVVTERVIDFTLLASGETDQETWENRNALSRAFLILPNESKVERGILRIERGGSLPVLETEAVPRSGPIESDRLGHNIYYDIELLCPDPFFRETADSNVTMQQAGGFQFPVQHPFEMVAFNLEAEIINNGDIAVPLRIRLYGEATSPRLTNITTGKAIEVTGAVAAGEYVEINTGFGKKSIELVAADGTRSNIMGRLNLAFDDFFKLQRGANTIRFSAASNISGKAVVDWRQQYAGI